MDPTRPAPTTPASPAPSPSPGAGPRVDVNALVVAAKAHLARAARSDFSRDQATAEERAALASAPIPVPSAVAQDYAAWRRSMAWAALLPVAFVVVVGAIDWLTSFDTEGVTGLFHVLTFALLVCEAALLAGVLTGIRRWREVDVARRRLWTGWLVHFLGPILVSLVPLLAVFQNAEALQGPLPDVSGVFARMQQGLATAEDQQTLNLWGSRLVGEALRVWFGLALLLQLAPTFLALFPGVTRAGLTLKTLLPGRSAAAAVAGLMAPIYAAGFLLVGVLLQQIGGSFLLAGGLLLFLAGPLAVTRRMHALIPPMSVEEAGAKVREVRRKVLGYVFGGGILVVSSLFVIEILGMRLVGVGDRAMLGPFDVLKMVMKYAANFTVFTVVASDFLLRGMHRSDQVVRQNAASEHFRRDADRLAPLAAALEGPGPAASAQPGAGA